MLKVHARALADRAAGHAGAIEGDKFPRGKGGSATLDELRQDNGGPATVFADSDKALAQ